MKPLVSIIVPTWHRYELLATRLLPSVLSLDVPFECLIVADGPGDAAADVVATFADKRLRFFEIERPDYPAEPLRFARAKGTAAINAGIDRARGTWISISGDDDAYTPHGLGALIREAADEDDVVFGISTYLRADGSWLEAFDGPPRLAYFPTGGAIVRRAHLGQRRLDPFAWRRGIGSDLDFWRGLAADGFRFHGVSELVFRYYPSALRAA